MAYLKDQYRHSPVTRDYFKTRKKILCQRLATASLKHSQPREPMKRSLPSYCRIHIEKTKIKQPWVLRSDLKSIYNIRADFQHFVLRLCIPDISFSSPIRWMTLYLHITELTQKLSTFIFIGHPMISTSTVYSCFLNKSLSLLIMDVVTSAGT